MLRHKIKKDKKGWPCSTHRRNVYKFWVRKPEGTKPTGIPRNRCEDNIKWIFGT
jgi:hypothetical protein